MNGLDFAIVFTFLAVIGLGFFGGIVRVLAAVCAIYVASIISATFYEDLSDIFREYVSSITLPTAQLFVFVAVFLVTAISVWFTLARGFKGMKLPRRLEIADNLGGATLGIVVSGLAVTVAVMLISILLQVLNQTMGSSGTSSLGGAVQSQIRSSQLVPVFLDFAPYFNRLIGPWFPNGTPAILN